MPNVVSPRQIAGTAFMGLAMLALAPPAFGQAAAPSSVIPQTLRPPPGATTAPAIPSTTDQLTPPPGAAKLVVQVSAIQVDGVFPEVAGGITAVDERLTGRLELSHADSLVILKHQVALWPYVFAAAGIGSIDNPTAWSRPPSTP